jgi:hypothetical protein
MERVGLMATMILAGAVSVSAQQPAPAQPPPESTGRLSISSLTVPVGSSPSIDWAGFHVDAIIKRDPFMIDPSNVPYWQAGVRLERQVTSRLGFAASATAARGRQAAAVNTTELGTGHDLSVRTPFLGPDSKRTVFDTNLAVSVYLKRTGRLRVKAVGELWNPFMSPMLMSATATRDVDRTRTLKSGLAFVF